jgi:hypothetical protein
MRKIIALLFSQLYSNLLLLLLQFHIPNLTTPDEGRKYV